MRLRPHHTIAAVLALALMSVPAAAEDWTLDTGALGAPAPTKGKKAKSAAARPDAAAKSAAGKPDKSANGKAENRQFGELEGWSPGKAPPKKKEKEDESSRFGKAPVNMNSNGGMAVGMPF